jgi:hypothetical protein
VKLRLSHRFFAPMDAVVSALASAEYAAHLAAQHSFFADIRVLSLRESADAVERELRYRARPFITRLGVFSLPASWFVWVEQSRFDLRRGLLTFENVPEVESVRGKLINRGTMQFRTQLDEAGRVLTTRESCFELAFQVPAVYRPLAELGLTMVARQLESSLDEEARLLSGWLARTACAPADEVAAA